MSTASAEAVSHRQVWLLAWPMIISNISTPLLGLVDTVILGHLPQATDLAAVALGASLMTFVFWSFGFLRMGTTGLVARAEGQQQQTQVRAIFWRSVHIALALSLLLWLLQWLLLPAVLAVISEPGQVQSAALEYSQIRIWSAPMVLINYVIIGWFVGRQNTRVPLVLVLVLNLSNIVLDIVLVWWLGLGSAGAAWASFAAEAIAAVGGLWWVLRCQRHWPVAKAGFDWHNYRALLVVNGHLFIRTAVLLSVLLFFTAQGAQLGEATLAANAILLQLIAFISYGLDGFAHAAEALIGRAAGAKNRSAFIQACLRTSQWSMVTALALTVLLLLVGPALVTVFSDIEPVRAMAQQYYGWIPWFPLVSMAAYQLDGICIGWGRTDAMQWSMVVSAILVFFPLWAIIGANSGLWAGFLLFNASRGILLFGFLSYKLARGQLW